MTQFSRSVSARVRDSMENQLQIIGWKIVTEDSKEDGECFKISGNQNFNRKYGNEECGYLVMSPK